MKYRLESLSFNRQFLTLTDLRGHLHVAKVVAGAPTEGMEFQGDEPGVGALARQSDGLVPKCLVALTLIDCSAAFAGALIQAAS